MQWIWAVQRRAVIKAHRAHLTAVRGRWHRINGSHASNKYTIHMLLRYICNIPKYCTRRVLELDGMCISRVVGNSV